MVPTPEQLDPARPPRLDPDRSLAVLRTEADRLLGIARRGDDVLGRPVPTCPGWTVTDLLVHVGHVYLHKVANMRTQAPAEWPPEPTPPEGETLPWLEAALDTLLAELQQRGPAGPSYTWFPPDQTCGFWYRRMAQETVVHRVDAETAVGEVSPVPLDVALDGIDELLAVFLPSTYDGDRTSVEPPPDDGADGQVVAVRTGPHVWRVVLEPASVRVDRGPGPAEATVTGEPSELLLWLWGRRPDGAVTTSGQREVVALLRGRLDVAVQ